MNLIECDNNEVLSEDIYDLEGSVLVGKNASITPYIIEKLESSRIMSVPVYPSIDETSGTNDLNFNGVYKEGVLALKEIINCLVIGEDIDSEQIKEISNTLYEEIQNNNLILDQIKKFKFENKYTYNHSVNVALYSLLIGKWIGLNEIEMKKVVKAGLLHDIGKTKIAPEIISKKGKLTKKEFETIKTHSEIGYEMSKAIPNIDEDVRQAILSHHEREDGSGYPCGLKGNKINLYAKILAIADVYDALTSERVYKDKSTPFEAIEEFRKMGIHSFDIKILNVFFKSIIQYYVNSKVKTNNGEVGEIVFIPPNDITKPVIRLENSYVELSRNRNIKIVEIVS